MKQRETTHYIRNADIYGPLSEYVREYRAAKKNKRPLPQLPDSIGRAILLIATNLASKGNFSGYSFREDMIADGCENCVRYLHNFDPDKSKNPFGYITLIMWRAFIRRIQKEHVQSAVRHKLILNHSDILDAMEGEGGSRVSSALDSLSMEKSSDIVESYEGKVAKKKRPKK